MLTRWIKMPGARLVFAVVFFMVTSAAFGAPRDDRAYRAGIGLLNKGLNDLAEVELRAYLRESPDGPEAVNARYSLGVCLSRLGRHAEAGKELDAVIDAEGFALAADAMFLRARCARATADEAAACSVLARLVERFPEWDRADHASMMLGESHYRRGKFDEAARVLAAIGARWPKSEWGDRAELFRAMSEFALGDHESAERRAAGMRARATDGEYAANAALIEGQCLHHQAEFAAAAERYGAASRSADEGTRAAAFLGLAGASRALRDWSAAERALKEAELVGASAERVAHERGALRFERVALLSDEGKDGEAVGAWERWRQEFVGHEFAADALAAEAWAAHRAGLLDRSVEISATLADRFPERAGDESARLLVAENEYAAGRMESALAAYEALMRAFPAGAHAQRAGVRRGVCLSRLERDEEAESVLRPLLKSGDIEDSGLRRAGLVVLGHRAVARQDWKAGEEWFASLASEAESNETSLDARLRLGVCIQRQGDHARAIPEFERVLKDGAASAPALQARFERGQSLVELGRLDEARAAMEEVIAMEAGEPRLGPHARRYLASIASRQGRAADAAEALSHLTNEDSWGDASLELSDAWLAAGRYGEAESVLAEFIKSHGAGAEASGARVRLAVALNRQGKHGEAVAALDGVADASSLEIEARASAGYERGLALRSLGQKEQASESYRAVLALGGSRVAAYAAADLAQMEMAAGRHAEALRLALVSLAAADRLDAAEGETARERAGYMRVACLVLLKEWNEAEAAAAEFIGAHAESELSAAVRLLRGEALLSAGRAKEAADEFSKASASTGEDAVRAGAMLRLIEAFAACQEWQESERAAVAYLKQFPDSELWFQARFAQGWARENDGRHEGAIEAYKDVVARHQGPTAARAQFQVGECLYALMKHEQAVAEFLKADLLFAYPEWSAAALYEAGRCLAELDRGADATKQFEELESRFPDSEWAALARDGKASRAAAPIPGKTQTGPPKAGR